MPSYITYNTTNERITEVCMKAVNRSTAVMGAEPKVYGKGKLDPQFGNALVYPKVMINGVVYRSANSQINTRNMDSCVKLRNGFFCVVEKIVQSNDDVPLISIYIQLLNSDRLEFQGFPEINIEPFQMNHIFTVTKTNVYESVQISEIVEKCIYLEIRDEIYVCKTANKCEVQ